MTPAPEKPNILWLCTDQQRYDTIASLGNPLINTPSIDSLVRDGTAFTRAYVQSPICAPSRASFLTGRYPRTTRCRQNGQAIPADEVLISKMFRDAGYTCGLAGKLHLASCSDGRVEERTDDGYDIFHWSHHPQPDWPENAYTQWLTAQGKTWDDLYDGPSTPFVKHGIPAEYHQSTWAAEMCCDFIKEQADSGPWLFSLNCFDPHHPFDPPADYLSRYNPADMPLPNYHEGELENKPLYQKLDHEWAHNEPGYFHVAGMSEDDQRQVCAAYYAMIELIDDQVGRILDALEESGQADNTLVIFMSDHGEMLGDHGIYLKGPHFYEAVVHVPVVLRWPGKIRGGEKADTFIELVDLCPTLLEAAGLEIPERVQGKSFYPVCTDKAADPVHRDSVYSEYYNAWTHQRSYGTMLRTEKEKIVVYHGDEIGELYDLEEDPDEFTNLWDDPGHKERKLELLKRAFDRSVLTMDPTPPRLGAF